MKRSEAQAIVSARRMFAAAFASRCPLELIDRPLGVLRVCRERPSAAAHVTIVSAAWPLVYRPVPLSEVTL